MLEKNNYQQIVFAKEYYQGPFHLFNNQLKEWDYSNHVLHPCRTRFWNLIPDGEYKTNSASELVHTYLRILTNDVKNQIEKKSLAYWLHLYRRIAPFSPGPDHRSMTIQIIRGTLDAAIQKYSQLRLCNNINYSDKVPLESVLNGILLSDEFKVERAMISKNPQLVLTQYGALEHKELFELEKKCYEIWWCSTLLRGIGKGAILKIDSAENVVGIEWQNELRFLVNNFDSRTEKYSMFNVSSSAVVFKNYDSNANAHGVIFLPIQNYEHNASQEFELLCRDFLNFEFKSLSPTNFVWSPLNIRDYRNAHLPLSESFEKKYQISLDAVLLVIVGLCHIALSRWLVEKDIKVALRHWQRAYDGPVKLSDVISVLKSVLPVAGQILDIKNHNLSDDDLQKVIKFFTLNNYIRTNMDIEYAGPHSIFLPIDNEFFFIDYAYIYRRLYDLFYGIKMDDQNFKGEILEEMVRIGDPAITHKKLKSKNGEERQIDASFKIGDRLVIVECRAVNKSIGFIRGDTQAINFRINKIKHAIEDIDEKAEWLNNNPIGNNYDVSKYSDILPIAVTPFIEYIHTLDDLFWLTKDMPRVLSPFELQEALKNNSFKNVKLNIVTLE